MRYVEHKEQKERFIYNHLRPHLQMNPIVKLHATKNIFIKFIKTATVPQYWWNAYAVIHKLDIRNNIGTDVSSRGRMMWQKAKGDSQRTSALSFYAKTYFRKFLHVKKNTYNTFKISLHVFYLRFIVKPTKIPLPYSASIPPPPLRSTSLSGAFLHRTGSAAIAGL